MWFILLACSERAPVPIAPPAASPAPTPKVRHPEQATPAQVEISLDAPASAELGDNVLLHFQVKNISSTRITIDRGSDYRATGRAERFLVLATHTTAESRDPVRRGLAGGGLGGPFTLEPGEMFTASLPLWRYVDLTAGSWELEVWHDLGMSPRATDRSGVPLDASAPSVKTELEVVVPDAASAKAAVAKAMTLPATPNISVGERAAPHADFRLFRHPVFAEPLVVLAAQDPRGLTGLAEQRHPAGTRALLSLGTPAALDALTARLHDEACWDTSTKRQALDLGWAALEDGNPMLGARIVAALGSASDLPRLEAAANHLLPGLEEEQAEQGAYPRPQTVTGSLLFAAEKLVERGGVVQIAAFFAILEAPTGPQRQAVLTHPSAHVRAVGLERMPAPAPAEIEAALESRWPAEKAVGITKAGQSGDSRHVPALTGTLATTEDPWLFSAAVTALRALQPTSTTLLTAAERLDDPAAVVAAFGAVSQVFASNGGGGSQEPATWASEAFRDRWKAFLVANRTVIDAGERLPIDASLVPEGYTLNPR